MNCINCGSKATVKHHVVPKILGGNDTTNVVNLCSKRHGLIHGVSFDGATISHSELTKAGLQKAKQSGKQLGLPKGTKLTTQKSIKAKNLILQYSLDFNGILNDAEVMKICEISRNSYYKYKKELSEEENNNV